VFIPVGSWSDTGLNQERAEPGFTPGLPRLNRV
jgi:hypothetical protein